MNNNTNKFNCECFICGMKLYRKPSDIKRVKDGRVTCSRECVAEKQSIVSLEKIEKKLNISDFKEWLIEKYHDEKLNTREIAKIVYGRRTNSPNVLGWMKRFGIESRERSEAISLQWKDNPERKRRQSEYAKNKFSLGSPARNKLIEVMQTKEYRENASRVKIGRLNPMWDESLSASERIDRKACPLNARWMRAVKRRDDNTCQCCGISGVTMVAHHLNGYHWDVENRHNVDNGVTLCEPCHNDFHNKYGRRNNTKEQYKEYVSEIKNYDTKQLALL